MTEVDLRPFQPQELPLIEPWFLDVETQRWLGDPDWLWLMLNIANRPLGEFRGARETGRFRWTAWDGDIPVGYVDCGTYDRWTTWDGERAVGAIEVSSGAAAFTVAPARRRMGYGRQILHALFDTPELANIELIGGGVEPENVASIACLRSAGFRQENTEPDFEGIVYFVRRR